MTHRVLKAAKATLFVALICVVPGLLSAQQSCFNFTMQGTWAFFGTGSMAGPAGPLAITMVGLESFDGTNKTTLTETASFGGTIVRTGFSGTYKVNQDCTGTITGTFPDGSTGHLDFVILNNGKTIYAMESDSGVNLLVTMNKQ